MGASSEGERVAVWFDLPLAGPPRGQAGSTRVPQAGNERSRDGHIAQPVGNV